MNKFFQDRVLLNNIESAINEAKNAKEISHRFLRGRVREIVLEHLLRPILTKEFAIGTGKITDLKGNSSNEIDLIVYSQSLVPPVMYSERLGIFPVESCMALIEVKSKLTSTKLDEAIKISRSGRMNNFIVQTGQFHHKTGKPIGSRIALTSRSLFAFESDISMKDEFERYKSKDKKWMTDPEIQSICIVGKGYWFYNEIKGWGFVPATSNRNEVLAFLRIIADSIHHAVSSRGKPLIGGYLIDDMAFMKIK